MIHNNPNRNLKTGIKISHSSNSQINLIKLQKYCKISSLTLQYLKIFYWQTPSAPPTILVLGEKKRNQQTKQAHPYIGLCAKYKCTLHRVDQTHSVCSTNLLHKHETHHHIIIPGVFKGFHVILKNQELNSRHLSNQSWPLLSLHIGALCDLALHC